MKAKVVGTKKVLKLYFNLIAEKNKWPTRLIHPLGFILIERKILQRVSSHGIF